MASERGALGKPRSTEPPQGHISPSLRRVRRLTAGLAHHRAPAWSSDGRLLAFLLDEGDAACWVICDRKGRVARVLSGPGQGRASFAPDGSLAYGRAVGAAHEIWLSPPWSSARETTPAGRRLLGGDGRLYCDPAFSPDGRYLAYIADDGHPGTARRLWALDLLTDEHRLLLAALPGQDAPSRLARPAWSPQGDALYFEAHTREGDAIFVLPLPSPWGATTPPPQRLTEAGYLYPAPVSSQAVLCERRRADGDSRLVLIEHGISQRLRPTEPMPRPIELHLEKGSAAKSGCLREPSLGHGKRGLWLAFSAPSQRSEEEPSRSDLFAARLQGLSARLRQKLSDGARPGLRPAGAETP